ncbi:hypothetical protein [uncultured Marixanthomonas sp.]|uniref:hypothetical protein n=1 Tax=uncultured Marixanthomonas sp. TaxID=757245 RepID=UPI0030DDB18F
MFVQVAYHKPIKQEKMENKPLQSNVFSDSVMKNLQGLTNMSMEFYGTMLDNMTGNSNQFSKNAGQLGKNVLQPLKTMFNTGDCCPPQEECPPHCLTSMHRTAMKGERIIIPFYVKNDCNAPKKYRVGARPLIDQDGNDAGVQLNLNKNAVQLAPFGKERVLLHLDTGKLENGTYTSEIVLREKEYNQNICLTVEIADHPGITVTPHEEKKYKLRWQSWKSHYYCEPIRDQDQDR